MSFLLGRDISRYRRSFRGTFVRWSRDLGRFFDRSQRQCPSSNPFLSSPLQPSASGPTDSKVHVFGPQVDDGLPFRLGVPSTSLLPSSLVSPCGFYCLLRLRCLPLSQTTPSMSRQGPMLTQFFLPSDSHPDPYPGFRPSQGFQSHSFDCDEKKGLPTYSRRGPTEDQVGREAQRTFSCS